MYVKFIVAFFTLFQCMLDPVGPLPPSKTSPVGPNALVSSLSSKALSGSIFAHFRGSVSPQRPPVPIHAFNHLPYPFPFTLDGYWTLVRPLTLTGASPVVADPLFSLPSHNLLRDGFCPSRREYFTSTDLPVPIYAFKHHSYPFLFPFNAYWTLL